MKKLTLRVKLFIFILVVMIPFMIIQVQGILFRYEQAVNAQLHSNKDFAEATAAAFTNFFRHVWDLELSIGTAMITAESTWSPEEMKQYMINLVNLHPTICGFAWVNAKGEVIASTGEHSSGNSVQTRSYYQQILTGEEKVISDLLRSNDERIPFFVVARGIRSHGILQGVVVAKINVDKFCSVLSIHREYSTASYGLVDRQGYIVYRYGSPELSFEQRRLNPKSPFWGAIKGETVLASSFGLSYLGEKRMGASVPIKEVGWAAFATVGVNDILHELRRKTMGELFILSLISLFAVFAAYLISNHFLQPIRILQHMAQALSEGQFHVRTRMNGRDELARTGQVFDAMADRLQNLNEANRNRFLQTTAHELRNPMAAIKGTLALIQRRVMSGKPAHDLKPLFQLIEREVDRLSQLLNQILLAFRTQQEKDLPMLIQKPVNILDVVHSALTPLKATNHQFQMEVQSTPLWVSGDPEQLEQVFLNILINAVQYSPEGGTTSIHVSQEGETVRIAIQDEGIGIPPEELHHIFDSFYRLYYRNVVDRGGMGLGLYIAKQIILQHGGEIWGESNQKGSTIHVKLPMLTREKPSNP